MTLGLFNWTLLIIVVLVFPGTLSVNSIKNLQNSDTLLNNGPVDAGNMSQYKSNVVHKMVLSLPWYIFHCVYLLFSQISPDRTTAQKGSDADRLNIDFWHGLVASFSVIIVSELGDKTFFIAAILAMRHSRCAVFLGAAAALFLMTVLSGESNCCSKNLWPF